MKQEPIEKILNINPTQLNAYSSGLLQGKAYQQLYLTLNHGLSPFALSIPEWKLLGQLYEHGKMHLALLAEHLGYDAPMVTKLAKQLEKKEYITLNIDSDDSRAKIIHITQKGKELIVAIEPEIKKVMAHALRGITQNELQTYIKVFITIVNNKAA